jgi:acyl-CoA reductase-like NAD-dependent aldehyde dehydrogenase
MKLPTPRNLTRRKFRNEPLIDFAKPQNRTGMEQVIADVSRKARIFQEEIFGPALAVTRAKDFVDALAVANDSKFGLTGAVYSRNAGKVARAAEELFVGNLYMKRKCTEAMVGAHPFGGFNMSGTDSKRAGRITCCRSHKLRPCPRN